MKLLYDKDNANRADVSSLWMLVYIPTQLQKHCSETVKLLPSLEKYFVHGGFL